MIDLAPIRAFLDDRHLALAEELQAFVAAEIAPLPPPVDDDAGRRQAREIVGLLGKATLMRFLAPVDLRALCLVREALAHASPLADDVFALQCLGAMPILLGGTAEQKERFAAPILAGRALAAFAMTEPEAGSDVAALATRALPEGDGYRLDGKKTLISNAGIADLYTVFASTDPARGARGISCFVVEASAVGFVRAQFTSEPHPLGELAFDCVVGGDARIGAEGGGFKLGMAALDRLRPTVAAAATGMAAR